MWRTEFIPSEEQLQIKISNFPLHHFAPQFLFALFCQFAIPSE